MSTSATRPRIAFVGNCQAQALQSLSGHLGLPIEVLPLPAIFDLDSFAKASTWERMQSCDFVFHQRVGTDYPIEFARPDVLRQRLGSRAISWPNVYFDGYFPEIEYLYSYSGKIVGPMADYHFGFIRSAWSHRVSVDDLTRSFMSGRLAQGFRQAADRSLSELRRRERGLTVHVSDWIASRWRYSKLLYVMNHPDNATLFELLQRLLRAAGLRFDADADKLSTYPYTLNEISIPAYPSLHQAYGLRFEVNHKVRGKRVEFGAGEPVVHKEAYDYDWPELFAAYYRYYDGVSASSASIGEILRNARAWNG